MKVQIPSKNGVKRTFLDVSLTLSRLLGSPKISVGRQLWSSFLPSCSLSCNRPFLPPQLGIFVVYFLDYCVGSGWWMMVLFLLQVGAVLMVRGRPYSGEAIASTLFHKTTSCLLTWAAPMLTFTWNVILPVILMVSVSECLRMPARSARLQAKSACLPASWADRQPAASQPARLS